MSDATEATDGTRGEEELLFLARTKTLCAERNLPLEKVKNARDLASCARSPVVPNRIYRTGRVSDATGGDIEMLFGKLGLKTLVDLRSPTELREDPMTDREAVFENFTSIVWNEKGRKHSGVVTELEAGEPRIRKKSEGTNYAKGSAEGVRRRGSYPDRKERHFVSLMDELKYVKGTLPKLRKRDIARVLLQSPAAAVSKRARVKIKTPFVDEINDGGLPMLNELILRFGAPGIRYVLELCADRTRHPVAFYCTAGKDRTGIIAAIILAVLGVPDDDIVDDYSLSANVYAEMNDHKAMVGALSQRNLNPKTFLGAPRQVMLDTLVDVRENYGSVKGYLDWIGFGAESQENLRKALLDES